MTNKATMQLPNVKTNPILMSLITVTFVLVFGVTCAFGGWTLRIMAESRAELAVVVDDSEFMQWLEARVHDWMGEFKTNQEEFYEQNKEIPDCLANPMPQYYRDNDYGLQRSEGEYEE
jgi:hypothetical protein